MGASVRQVGGLSIGNRWDGLLGRGALIGDAGIVDCGSAGLALVYSSARCQREK